MKDIGTRIRAYRKRAGLTLIELADQSGLSASFISKIESEKLGLSVESLDKLTTSLGLRLGDLLEQDEQIPMVSSRDLRSRLHLGGNIFYEQVSPSQANFLLSTGVVTSNPGDDSGELTEHEGDEVHFIIKGKFRFTIGGEEFILKEGDAISTHAKVLHKWENIGDVIGTFLVVGSMPQQYE